MKTLLALGQNAFQWTWKTSVSAALLVALVFLAQKLLSRWLTPRLRYTLSLLILIRLLFPVVPSSPLSLENLFLRRAVPAESASAPIAPKPATEEANPAPLAGIFPGISPGISPGNPLGNPPGVSPAVSHVPAPPAPGLSLRARISLVWACGFLCLMALAVWRYRQWIRLMAQGQPISDPPLLELLDSARQDMGVRHPVKLVAVARLSSPAVFGFWRVCLLLPQSAASQLSAQELRMVFLHEMAHVRRHDVGLNFLLIAVQFLHWFNPLVWLASHRIRADREMVCDAMTLSRLPAAERPRYGQVLLKLMENFSAETPFFPGAVPVVGSKQEIKQRLLMIKHQRHGSFGAGLATALALAALACATFTRAQDSHRLRPIGRPEPGPSHRLVQRHSGRRFCSVNAVHIPVGIMQRPKFLSRVSPFAGLDVQVCQVLPRPRFPPLILLRDNYEPRDRRGNGPVARLPWEATWKTYCKAGLSSQREEVLLERSCPFSWMKMAGPWPWWTSAAVLSWAS